MFLKSVVVTNIKLAQFHCSNNNFSGILVKTMVDMVMFIREQSQLGDHGKITTKYAEKNQSQQMIAIS